MQNVGLAERAVSISTGVLAASAGVWLHRRDARGAFLAALGTALVARGATGYCPVNHAIGRDSTQPEELTLDVRTTLTVQAEPDRVYGEWRALERLPNFMRHVERVERLREDRFRWTARVPGIDHAISWEAQIVRDDGRVLSWRPAGDGPIEASGQVSVRPVQGDRGTELRVQMSYGLPTGTANRALARIVHPAFEILVREDVRRFKSWIEAGEVPTIEGQPHA